MECDVNVYLPFFLLLRAVFMTYSPKFFEVGFFPAPKKVPPHDADAEILKNLQEADGFLFLFSHRFFWPLKWGGNDPFFWLMIFQLGGWNQHLFFWGAPPPPTKKERFDKSYGKNRALGPSQPFQCHFFWNSSGVINHHSFLIRRPCFPNGGGVGGGVRAP